jgi:hypothetical protein
MSANVNGNLGMPKDLAKIARRLRRQGWTMTVTGGCHVRWTCTCGHVMHTGMTPGQGTIRAHTARVRSHHRACEDKTSWNP